MSAKCGSVFSGRLKLQRACNDNGSLTLSLIKWSLNRHTITNSNGPRKQVPQHIEKKVVSERHIKVILCSRA